MRPGPDPSGAAGDASIGELVGAVSRDLSTLMRQELELARVELRSEAAEAGRSAAALGGAAFAGHMVLLFVSFAVAWGLAEVMAAGWAAVLVAAMWATAAVPLYLTGRRRLARVRPVPERTARTLRNVPDALRGR